MYEFIVNPAQYHIVGIVTPTFTTYKYREHKHLAPGKESLIQ